VIETSTKDQKEYDQLLAINAMLSPYDWYIDIQGPAKNWYLDLSAHKTTSLTEFFKENGVAADVLSKELNNVLVLKEYGVVWSYRSSMGRAWMGHKNNKTEIMYTAAKQYVETVKKYIDAKRPLTSEEYWAFIDETGAVLSAAEMRQYELAIYTREFGTRSVPAMLDEVLYDICTHEVKHQWDDKQDPTNAAKYTEGEDELLAYSAEVLYSEIPGIELVYMLQILGNNYFIAEDMATKEHLRPLLRELALIVRDYAASRISMNELKTRVKNSYNAYVSVAGTSFAAVNPLGVFYDKAAVHVKALKDKQSIVWLKEKTKILTAA